MRSMTALLTKVQISFPQNTQGIFKEIEISLERVTDIMTGIARELDRKDSGEFLDLRALALAQGKSNRTEKPKLFQMPSLDTLAPNQKAHTSDGDTGHGSYRSGNAKFFRAPEMDGNVVDEFRDASPTDDSSVLPTDKLGTKGAESLARNDTAGGRLYDENISLNILVDSGRTIAKTAANQGKSRSKTQSKGGTKNPSKQGSVSAVVAQQRLQSLSYERQQSHDFDLAGNVEATFNPEDGEKIQVDLKINAKIIREQLKNTNISEMYRNLVPQRMREAQFVQDPLKMRIEANEKDRRWKYQRLAQCKAMATYITYVIKNLREQISEFQQTEQRVNQFEFLICIDNSGSMGTKERAVTESIVVLIEVLRKLEFRFAISLVGREPGKLLLDFDGDFNVKKGEEIVESFTFDEPTRLASCLRSLSKKVWEKRPKAETTKRMCITITDGFNNDREEDIIQIVADNFKCGMLLIRDTGHDRRERFLQRVCSPGCHSIIDTQDVSRLPAALIALIKTMIDLCNKESSTGNRDMLQRAKVLPPEESQLESTWTRSCKFELVGKKAREELEAQGASDQRVLISVSPQGKDIPLLQKAIQDERLVAESNSETWEEFEDALSGCSRFYEEIEKDVKFSRSERAKVQNYWDELTRDLSQDIEEYVNVLEEHALPLNKYTRKRGALKGSSLHLPGLVKAVSSNFTYKRFFAQKTAGGKRNYSICLALDLSVSMDGHLGDCASETMICMIAALEQCEIPFSIVLFGKHIRIIKMEEQVWGPAVLWTLMSHLRTREDVTYDADGIDAALRLVSMRSDAEKKIFVLSDGYGTCGLRMPLVLDRAQVCQELSFSISMHLARMLVSLQKRLLMLCSCTAKGC